MEGYVDDVSKEPGEKIDVEAGEILTVFVAKNPPKTETEPTETEPLDTEPVFPPPIEFTDPPIFTEETYMTNEPDITIKIYD